MKSGKLQQLAKNIFTQRKRVTGALSDLKRENMDILCELYLILNENIKHVITNFLWLLGGLGMKCLKYLRKMNLRKMNKSGSKKPFVSKDIQNPVQSLQT